MNKQNISSFICGFWFACGLGISGMTQPQKVVGFLDLFGGDWDPSLIFVMAGAVLVYSIGYRWVIKKPAPLFSKEFLIPGNRQIDSSLILGSALFGMGWGIAGFCPGPALTSVSSLTYPSLVFVASMLAAMAFYEWVFTSWRARWSK